MKITVFYMSHVNYVSFFNVYPELESFIYSPQLFHILYSIQSLSSLKDH